jgi:ubiquinone/menaquinone biosynthesis C-methylase UbiE
MSSYWDKIAGVYEKFMSPLAWIESQRAVIEGLSGRVLEACCGTGQLLVEMLQRGIDAHGIDLSPKMVEVARHRLLNAHLDPQRVLIADVTALPYDDQSFDYAVTAGSLGLLPVSAKRGALRELVRVCRTEVRLLEPMERHPGFYLRRVLTFMVDGHRPIPQSLFSELGLDYKVEWDTMMGIFSYIRVPKPQG